MQFLCEANRDPVEVDLLFVDGYTVDDLPKDLYGHVFVNSATGTVNSGGLPYKQFDSEEDRKKGIEDPEYGSPMLNGDSKVIRLDFDRVSEGIVRFKSRMLAPPTMWADMATGKGGPAHDMWKYRNFRFHNGGYDRGSSRLGSHNQLNTAIIPVRYPGDQQTRLLATTDAGRPYEFDPINLKVMNPVGWNKDWASTLPRIIQKPFPIIYSTAHPVFDPVNQDFYLVNFRKSISTMISALHFSDTLARHPEYVHRELKEFAQKAPPSITYEERVKRLEDLYHTIPKRIRKHMSWWEKVVEFFIKVVNWLRRILHKIEDDLWSEDQVFLLRWDGKAQKMKRWRVVDEEGNDIRIAQIMHQMSLSEDYLILMDSSFKFTMDQAYTNPFESRSPIMAEIDRMIRDHTTVPQESFTDTYLIKRSDLEKGDVVKAKKIVIDHSCLHFNANYENPDGKVTFFTSNNTASCAAEWIRPYDELAPPAPNEESRPLFDGWVGSFAVGNMDVCSVGKVVIDAEKGELDKDESIFYHKLGKLDDPKNIGAHTWSVALHTFCDIISAEEPSRDIKNIYWQQMGLFPQSLTQFIFDLYQNYSPQRIVPAEDVARYTWEKVPAVLIRTETSDMHIKDHYQFEPDVFMRSIQFAPRKHDTPPGPEEDLSTDGYIVLTMMVKVRDEGDKQYQAQVWIFDAADLKRGPLVKMHHPKVIFNYPLHSTWIPKLVSPSSLPHMSVQKDFDHMVDRTILFPWERRKVKRFLRKYVYPHSEK